MSLGISNKLRPILARQSIVLRPLAASRAFSVTPRRGDESHPSAAPKDPYPGDVVAHASPGPVTVHKTPEAIAADVVSDAPCELLPF